MKTGILFLMVLFSWCYQASATYSETAGGGDSQPQNQSTVDDNNMYKANICLLSGGTPESCQSVAILSTDAMKKKAQQIADLSSYNQCMRLYCPRDISHPLYSGCESSCRKKHLG